MKRSVTKEMPDGTIRHLHSFHVSMEGMETRILFRDDEDYDAMVKIICVCSRRKNVMVVIYAVVSNHCHVIILAASQKEADSYGEEIKRMYAMWMGRKYGLRNMLKKVDIKAIYLYNDWYLRNALAYVPRNALDNGCNVSEYPWSGYRAMFSKSVPGEGRGVAGMNKRDKRAIMHTGDDLNDVGWMVDGKGRLIPRTFCDYQYLEQAFGNDHAFFLKTIGGQNAAEMKFKLIESPRKMLNDNDFLRVVEEMCDRWFSESLNRLSLERKIRLIPYVNRTMKTSVAQLARTFSLPRDEISRILGRTPQKPPTMLFPGEVILARGDLEVAFDDPEVDVGVSGQREERLGFDLRSRVQDEPEFLLVDSGGSQQGRFHSRLEPSRYLSLSLVELLHWFQGMLNAGGDSVAQGDNAMDGVSLPQGIGPVHLLVGQADPAGIQAERLGQKNQFLAVIPHLFLGLFPFGTGHYKVVLYP